MTNLRRFLFSAVPVLLAASPAVSRAEVVQAETSLDSNKVSPRVQFEIGLQGGSDLYPGAGAVGGGMGIDSLIGVQVTDRLGLEAELSWGTYFFVMGYGRAGLLCDFTPRDWVTVAAGPVVGGNLLPFGSGASSSYAGATARIDFHLGSHRTEYGHRRAWTVGFAGDAGLTLASHDEAPNAPGKPAFGAFATLGYAFY